jgi:hypothetical protein
MRYYPRHAAPRNIRPVRRIMGAILAALALTAIAVLLLTPVRVHLDHYAGTYGVSAGTDTSYCSLEVWHPSLSCETAR